MSLQKSPSCLYCVLPYGALLTLWKPLLFVPCSILGSVMHHEPSEKSLLFVLCSIHWYLISLPFCFPHSCSQLMLNYNFTCGRPLSISFISVNSITCSSEMHAWTVSCAQTFISDEHGFEWQCWVGPPFCFWLEEYFFLFRVAHCRSLAGTTKDPFTVKFRLPGMYRSFTCDAVWLLMYSSVFDCLVKVH